MRSAYINKVILTYVSLSLSGRRWPKTNQFYSQETKSTIHIIIIKPISLVLLGISLLIGLIAQSCKKSEPEPTPDPYAFLKGTWQYANGAECVFDATTKTAKGTKVPTNNTQFKFVVGEDYWRNVSTTAAPEVWSYDQIVRFSDGKTVEYRKSTMTRKDANTLSMSTPGLSDSEMKRVP